MSDDETQPVSESAPFERVVGGTLYVVATPIGNLGDLSPRALRVLSSVDLIAAEDTRNTASMLTAFGVRTRMMALHDHNESDVAGGLIARLAEGASVALVSDAGTPLISDPGYRLVSAVRTAGLPVVAVPGPCALIAGLSISGLPTDAFSFIGFPPAKGAARQKWLQTYAAWPHTLVLYEASHRVAMLGEELPQLFGAERPICVLRELTKRFEQAWSGPAAELSGWLAADANRLRGEFVVVIGSGAEATGEEDVDRVLRPLLRALEPSRAARVAAEILGLGKNALYQRALTLAGKRED
jgi:16S rRNA (cytidine1402-2'-O)-methyltransferase